MGDLTKDPMHCPRDPSIECLKCPFETCVYDEPEEEHPLDRRKRTPMTEHEKELHRQRSKRYYEAHREEIIEKRNTPEFKAQLKEYHQKRYADPDKRAEMLRKNREWYANNREKALERSRRYYQEHKAEHKAYCAEYQRKNKELLNEKRRIERMKKNEENHNG
jgi:hypothetical protein